jgi:hypothetical protein
VPCKKRPRLFHGQRIYSLFFPHFHITIHSPFLFSIIILPPTPIPKKNPPHKKFIHHPSNPSKSKKTIQKNSQQKENPKNLAPIRKKINLATVAFNFLGTVGG